jgi:cob(I)alamin adenosyltransferase
MDRRQQSPASSAASSAEPRPAQGLVSVFTGDGRGKTSAAVGTAVRAAGYGLKVLMVFFMKGPDYTHGEVNALNYFPGITVRSFGERGWSKPGQDNTAHRLKAEEAIEFASASMRSHKYDVVVLDEVISAVAFGLLPVGAMTRFIAEKPAGMELILTGRDAPSEIIEKADLVTEMRNVKHPFDKGIPARAGIDY